MEWEFEGVKCLEKILSSAISSITNPIWIHLRWNLGCCGGRPVINHLSYDRACQSIMMRLLREQDGWSGFVPDILRRCQYKYWVIKSGFKVPIKFSIIFIWLWREVWAPCLRLTWAVWPLRPCLQVTTTTTTAAATAVTTIMVIQSSLFSRTFQDHIMHCSESMVSECPSRAIICMSRSMNRLSIEAKARWLTSTCMMC